MVNFSTLNFGESRKQEKQENRVEWTIDQLFGKCDLTRYKDNYFCGSQNLYLQSGNSLSYQGQLSFTFDFTLKDLKIKPNLLLSQKEKDQFYQCISQKIDILPEFRQCGDDYNHPCTTPDEIRKIGTQYYAGERLRYLYNNAKESLASAKSRGSEKEINMFTDQMSQLKLQFEDTKGLEKRWNEIFNKSIGRQFFFNGYGLVSEFHKDEINSIQINGVLLNPIGETLLQEMNELESATNEAVYSCLPEHTHLKNRHLKYFNKNL